MAMSSDTLLWLSLIIFIVPLLGFMIIIFNQNRLGKAAGILGTAFLGIDFILAAIVAFFKLSSTDAKLEGMIQWKYEWIFLGNKTISLGLGLDNLAAIMLIVVTLISFLVHLFSTEYMAEDKRFPRFYAYLGIFTFSMLGIVLANNLLNMYIFWELVGLSSYLLIGFWYEKDSAANASKKAFIMNRVGDLGFFAGIMIVYFTYDTFMFDDLFKQIAGGVLPFDSGTVLTAMGILIFMGAIGKSAQFPLHTWLPDAMEGPTPVSALIHAATMVAAGVYLTARVFPIFTADALVFIAYIGAITAFMAATIAITQNDFKKVLAYSTVSQLGYMIMALGIGAFTTGFMHLVTHAWFKACLFLASGSVIHAMHHAAHHLHDHHTDPQDIRNMGGLRKTMPKTYYAFLFATVAIAGVPLTSGFLSKDGILAGTLAFGNLSGHWFIPFAGFAAAGMTAFYMFRLAIISFHGEPKTKVATKTHENKWVITYPLILLAVLSTWFMYSFNPIDATSGWFHHKIKAPATAVSEEFQFDFLIPYYKPAPEIKAEDFMTGHGGGGMHGEAITADNKAELNKEIERIKAQVAAEKHAKGNHAFNKFEEEMHHQHYNAMFMSLAIAGFGILLSFIFYQFKIFSADNIANHIKPLYNFSLNKWYFDELYDKLFVGGTMQISKLMYWIDANIFDGIVNLSGFVTKYIGFFVGKFDNVVVDGIVNLSAGVVGFFGVVARKFQTGKIQTYLAMSVIGLVLLIWWLI